MGWWNAPKSKITPIVRGLDVIRGRGVKGARPPLVSARSGKNEVLYHPCPARLTKATKVRAHDIPVALWHARSCPVPHRPRRKRQARTNLGRARNGDCLAAQVDSSSLPPAARPALMVAFDYGLAQPLRCAVVHGCQERCRSERFRQEGMNSLAPSVSSGPPRRAEELPRELLFAGCLCSFGRVIGIKPP